jgi:hypothetical protein
LRVSIAITLQNPLFAVPKIRNVDLAALSRYCRLFA